MKTKEEIQNQIKMFEKELLQYYAKLGAFFTDLESGDPLTEDDDIYYVTNWKNIERVIDPKELIGKGLIDEEELKYGESYFYHLFIQYKNSNKIYFIDKNELIDDWGNDVINEFGDEADECDLCGTKMYQQNLNHIQEKISMLKDIIN